MKRRQFFPAMVGGVAGVTALNWLQSRPANATILNDLFDGATGSPSNPAPTSSAPVYSSSVFAEVYGQYYISREQFIVLQSGQAVHWWDIAPKPYARLKSEDASEHYYFPFQFGNGGAIVVCDTTGLIVSWDISGASWVPDWSPADMSEYNYYPPKAIAQQQAPVGCY
jgi:hypothetical protein